MSKLSKAEQTYCVFAEKRHHSELGEYFTYGIGLSKGRDKDILHDVSLYREKVLHMVELFNKHRLSALHLAEAVTDLLD